MKQILLVGAGGFIGSILRFLVSKLNIYWQFLSIPFGTLIVNVAGSFLIGILAGLAQRSGSFSLETRLFWMVGICGGFTTFSSFSLENLTLLQNGQLISFILYSLLSLLLGFSAVYAGYHITSIL